jgi:staphylococcal nuclease domain-containing protein 1
MDKTFEGLVKGVYSGDYIIVSGKVKKNSDDLPEEKKLRLSSVIAPRIVNENTPEEEPFAWESRNFLRSLILGKVIKYTVDSKSGEINLGQIFFEGKNVNIEIVKNGLAKVANVKKDDSILKTDYFTRLTAAENEAKKNKEGVWTEDQNLLAKQKRKVYFILLRSF